MWPYTMSLVYVAVHLGHRLCGRCAFGLWLWAALGWAASGVGLFWVGPHGCFRFVGDWEGGACGEGEYALVGKGLSMGLGFRV